MSDAGAPPPLPPLPSAGPPPLDAPPPLGAPPPLASPAPMGDGSAPPPPPPAPTDHASLHSTEQTRTYPCGSCGSELHFDIKLQKLACSSCGTTYELTADTAGLAQEQDLRSALTHLREGRALAPQAQTIQDKEIVCQNCGGHSTFSGSLTAERCPYCATPIQRNDVHDAPDRIPVDGVVPFTIDEKAATAAIEQWINSRRFAPTEFKTYNRTGSFTSIYTAYFTYDADTDTFYQGRRGDDHTVTVGSGDNRHTETRTDWHHVSGNVHNSFDDVTVFANDGFDSKRIAKLEPWPTQTAKPYSPEYVAGHLCRTYDHDVEECLTQATATMEHAIDQTIKSDIGGDHQDIQSRSITWQKMTYKHLLLPIWLLTVIYQEKPFQVYINGVTGEVQGARPWSKVKIIITAVIALLVLIAIIAIIAASKKK
ncbi:MAG: hypothetical protein JWL72_2845 [Ilumatobacteraceae bacterium]|nr:hypothetical protein [Ilumatobacteraceae bacterium]